MDIEDRDRLASTPARETALACIEAGIEAARPERVIEDRVRLDGEVLEIDEATYDLDSFEEVCVIGGGKAAAGVAGALSELLGDRVSGAVVAPGGDGMEETNETEKGKTEVLPGDHPVPSERGVESTEQVLDLARAAEEETLVLCVVTGGASALLAAPTEISLSDLQETTEALLASGAAIDEINAVRKHSSEIKGGGLARAAAPATVVGLMFSDVVGDDVSTIGSGPTAPDDTTFADALAVLDRYGIDAPAVRDRLERGSDGEIDETPGPSSGEFERVSNHVLADAHTALSAARAIATERGYRVRTISSTLRGEARVLGTVHAAIAEECLASGDPEKVPAVLLSGGEATVTVRGDGEGGPNTELALSAAIEFAEHAETEHAEAEHAETGHNDTEHNGEENDERVALCSVDTDGRDGATEAAGALVDSETLRRSRAGGSRDDKTPSVLNHVSNRSNGKQGSARDETTLAPADRASAREALANNDALTVLDDCGALVRTGETGTNVNDLRVLVIENGNRTGPGS